MPPDAQPAKLEHSYDRKMQASTTGPKQIAKAASAGVVAAVVVALLDGVIGGIDSINRLLVILLAVVAVLAVLVSSRRQAKARQ